MNRRDFAGQLIGGGAALALAGTSVTAQAQGPAEGTHYVRLQTPAPVSAAANKIEVVEFFWYECPHCNTLEPLLEGWIKKLPADVSFRAVPVGFTPRHQVGQKLFYTLEEMGQLEAMHKRVFAAIHVQRRRMSTDADVLAFVKDQGVDAKRFEDIYKSFQVNTKATRARQLSDAYKLDGVPALGIQGRFWTSPALAGGYDRSLAVTDFLIQRARNRS